MQNVTTVSKSVKASTSMQARINPNPNGLYHNHKPNTYPNPKITQRE